MWRDLTHSAALWGLPKRKARVAAAVQLVPSTVAVVHQEHRSSSDRTSSLEPLLSFAPRADAVVALTDSMAAWLREQIGDVLPTTLTMPNPLPVGPAPRSRLDRGLIVNAVTPTTLRFAPPITVTEAELEEAAGLVAEVLGDLADRAPSAGGGA